MRALVTGSHGLIGRALATAMTEAGDEVVALVRSPVPPAGSGLSAPPGGAAPGGAAPGSAAPVGTAPGGTAPGGVAPGDGPFPRQPPAGVRWDPAAGTVDQAALEAAGPFDAVVHLAGAGIGDRRWTPRRRREIRDSRVLATRLLVGALRRLTPRPATLVSGSAVGYYGDRGAEVLDEDSAPGTGFLAEVCRDWEREATLIGEGVRVVLLRSGVVLSARGGALARQLPIFRAGFGGPLGDGRQYVPWITLADEVSVIRRAIGDDRLAGPLNSTAPQPVTNAELAAAIGRALHRPAVLRVPRAALEVALGAGLAREALLASQRAVPARLLAAGHVFAHPDAGTALAAVLGGT